MRTLKSRVLRSPGFASTAKSKSPRGYVMLVVVLIGIALVAIATSTMSVAGAASTAAVKTEEGEQARAYAESGMERAIAYLNAVGPVEGDFDLVLDPDAAAGPSSGKQCDASTPPPVAGEHQPRWTGPGTALDVIFNGPQERWARVSLGDGAYLVRFDDDDDDQVVDPDLAAFTGNRINSTRNCVEGPTATAGFGGQNRFRDRNRTVWVTVIGIGPGTNPAQAQHRHTLRQLYTFSGPLPAGPAMQVDGNLSISGGGQFEYCSDLAGIQASIINQGGPPSQNSVCVGASAENLGGGQFSSGAASCGTDPCTPPPSDPFSPPVVGPLPNNTYPTDDQLTGTWSSNCIFYVAPTGSRGGVYYWEPSINPGVCTATGALVPPQQSGGTTGDARSECWVPLILDLGGTTVAYAPGANSASTPPGWSPRPPGSLTNLPVALAGHAYQGWNSSVTTPNFATTCPGSVAENVWKNGPPTPISCTNCTAGPAVFVQDGPRWRFNNASPDSFPAGIYYWDGGNFSVSADMPGWPAPPSVDTNEAAWAPITLVVVNGNALLDGNLALGFGRGQGTAPDPFRAVSLLVRNGNVDYADPNARFAGSVFIPNGNLDINATPATDTQFHGLLRVSGNLNITGGRKFRMSYDDDFGTGGGTPPSVASVTSSPGSY